jgi:hypothetical protein
MSNGKSYQAYVGDHTIIACIPTYSIIFSG